MMMIMMATMTSAAVGVASLLLMVIVVVVMMARMRRKMQAAADADSNASPTCVSRTCSTLDMAHRVRQDQGLHESEVSFGGEADLHQHLSGCQKNPGHTKFVPANQFGMEHLPPGYKDNDVVDMIKALSDLTVRLTVKFTSLRRPSTYPDSAEPYPFCNYKGENYMRTGTGWVDFVQLFREDENKRCACQECCSSSTPEKNWGNVYIATAAHLVYDDSEAKETTCHFFYDSSDTDLNSVLSFGGLRMADVSLLHRDWSWMRYITHDTQLLVQLFNILDRYHSLLKRVEEKYKSVQKNAVVSSPKAPSGNDTAATATTAAATDGAGAAADAAEDEGGEKAKCKLTVIVSHPHGCSKQVTVGEWTHTNSIAYRGNTFTQYIYTTPTCPGSSGAPVYILGKDQCIRMHTDFPHSRRCVEDGLNMSGFGCQEY